MSFEQLNFVVYCIGSVADALKEVSDVEQKPKMDGRFMTMMLIPKKEK